VLITLNLGQALRLEPGWLLALVLASCALFYVAQWDVYNTGVMRFAK
jgi:hypothetical protein